MCTYSMLLKIRKKTFWKFAFSIVFTCFKHPKLPICIKIPVTLLQIVYLFVALRPKSTAMVIAGRCKLFIFA